MTETKSSTGCTGPNVRREADQNSEASDTMQYREEARLQSYFRMDELCRPKEQSS